MNVLTEYNRTIFTQEQSKLLSILSDDWLKTKPLAGVKILHNIPVTHETLVKLESLVAAGADLTVTQVKFLPMSPKDELITVLKEAGISYIAKHEDINGVFDIALDCCAEVMDMKGVTITRGIVEITQSGGERYKQITPSIPVINVDDSNVKKLEGMYGTGESFVRAIKERTGQSIHEKAFLVFGFGKVGRGIVKYLLQETPLVTVVDSCENKLKQAKALGAEGIHCSDVERIKDRAKEVFCIVTATGQANVLSQYLNQEDCPQAVIANMGADDEIGDQFADEVVLCKRMAINFSLKHPTLMHFIDPIFYAHNIAAQLLMENNYAPGYHAFPRYVDNLIIKLWNCHYPMDISDIYLSGT